MKKQDIRQQYINQILNNLEIHSYLEYLYVIRGETDISELQCGIDSQDVLDNGTKTNFENELNSDFENYYNDYYECGDINLEIELMKKAQQKFNNNKQHIINEILNNEND